MSFLPVLFLGLLIVGAPALLAAIHLVIRGELRLGVLVALALVAMWTSDSIWYRVGRTVPAERLQRPGVVLERIRRIEALWRRMPSARLLFLSRFLYGTRIPVLLLCGLARMPYRDLWRINLVSSVLWLALLFAVAGSVGSAVESIWGENLPLALSALVLAGVGLQWGLAWLSRSVWRSPTVPPASRDVAAPSEAPVSPSASVRTVSVVVPAYNEERYLRRAIDSVRAQGIPAEVIVVENGSTDRTARIAADLADQVVRTPGRLGYSRARNLGASCASGAWLVFLDADSEMGPNVLEEILARSDRRGLGTVRGLSDDPRWRYRVFMWLKYVWQRLGLYRGVLGGLLFCDARLFREIGGFDEGLELDELRDFIVRSRRAGGRYRIVSSACAWTSMRRFEAVGLWSSLWFWIRFRLHLESGAAYRDVNHGAVERAEGDAGPRLVPGSPRTAEGQD